MDASGFEGSEPAGENVPDDLQDRPDKLLNGVGCGAASCAGTGLPEGCYRHMGIDRDGIAGFVSPGTDAPAPEYFPSGRRKAASGEGVFRSYIHGNRVHGSSAAVCVKNNDGGHTGYQRRTAAFGKDHCAYAEKKQADQNQRNEFSYCLHTFLFTGY